MQVDLCAEPDLPLATKEALYRIAQESLHNIVKHARANAVVLRLCAPTPQSPVLALDIRDDGVGFDPAGAFPGHLGLRSMRERAARLGGTLVIDSAPGRGTQIQVRVPGFRKRDKVTSDHGDRYMRSGISSSSTH